MRDHSLTAAPQRRAYAPYAQQIADTDHPALTLEIRTAGDPALVSTSVRAAIASVDRDLPIISVKPLSELMAQSVSEERLVVALAVAFGLTALVLASIGLYGVMSYAVARRTGEMGLRIALGAKRGDVLRLVLWDGLQLAALGVAGGLPLALIAARALRSQLHEVPPTDPVSMAAAISVLLLSAIIAAAIPALRAARVPPATALRQS